MPIYEYRCQDCGHVTETLIRTQRDIAGLRCEQCGERRLERVYLSTIAPVRSSSKRGGLPCCGEQGGCSDPKRCCQQST